VKVHVDAVCLRPVKHQGVEVLSKMFL